MQYVEARILKKWLPPVFRYLNRAERRKHSARRHEPRRLPEVAKAVAEEMTQHKLAANARDVVARFGGPYQLAKALAHVGYPKNAACIYRWLYPYPKGTGGRIPKKAWIEIQVAAKRAGVDLKGVQTLPIRRGKGLPGVRP